MKRVLVLSMCGAVVAAAGLRADQPATPRAPVPQAARPRAVTMSAEMRQKLTASLERGAAYLKQQQHADGTWENHPGVAGMAASALLRIPGRHDAELKTVEKTLTYLRSLAKPDGGIYDKDIPHYITAVSMMTFTAAGLPQDKPLIEKGRRYLAEHLLDEGEGVKKDDKFYGGLGYGGTSDGGRADIISLEYGLRAMKEGGLGEKDAAWDKAILFLQRTQNSEANDQPWAAKDGGFIYYPGYSQAGETRSYGSATYAGIMSYIWSNVKKDDRRVKAVLKWVRDNYTVDENPGIGQKTVYYYYMVFAKAQAMGQPVIVDAKGVSHNWREDLGAKLLSLQHPEGYWVNPVPDEMQDNKVLVTTFTMMAIEAALQN